MALDVGDKRIGVALSDPTEVLATPLTVIKRLNEASDIQNVVKFVNEHKAGHLIIGLPLSLSGESGMQAQKVKDFAARLAALLSVPMEMVDERFSTVTAREYMREWDKKKKARAEHDDAIAAAVILQNYLDEKREKRS